MCAGLGRSNDEVEIGFGARRGVGVTCETFAVESFVDERAANAKQDPLAYRVALLNKNPRAKIVL